MTIINSTHKPDQEQALQDLWLKECAEFEELPYKQHSDFQSAFWAYFKIRKWNPKKFADKTGLSEKIYSLFKNHKYKEGNRPALDSVIAICIGLHIPICCSLELINLCGYALIPSKLDRCYYFILSRYELFDIDKANNFLIENNLQPVSDKYIYKKSFSVSVNHQKNKIFAPRKNGLPKTA